MKEAKWVLRKRRIARAMAALGIGIMVWVYIGVFGMHHAMRDHVFLVVIGSLLGGLGGISLFRVDRDEIKDAKKLLARCKKWESLTGLPASASLEAGWNKKKCRQVTVPILTAFAWAATFAAEIRDKAPEALAAAIKDCTKYSSSWTRSSEMRKAHRAYNKKRKNADKLFALFNRAWDLCKEVDALPLDLTTLLIDVSTGDHFPYMSPNEFRKALVTPAESIDRGVEAA